MTCNDVRVSYFADAPEAVFVDRIADKLDHLCAEETPPPIYNGLFEKDFVKAAL